MFRSRLLFALLMLSILLADNSKVSGQNESIFLPVIQQDSNSVVRRVNLPFVAEEVFPRLTSRAIFWFGQVETNTNYVDGRIAYNDTAVHLHLNIFDQWLFFDNNPNANEFASWDAATVFLDLDEDGAISPEVSSYKFDAELSNYSQSRANYQAAYQGNGASWDLAATPFTTSVSWRGGGINDGTAARGWSLNFEIPFTSLGLSGAPTEGTEWRMAILVHDRDDLSERTIQSQSWPESTDGNASRTWGYIRFGYPTYAHPPVSSSSSMTVRKSSGGPDVVDAHVGGHTNCGEPFNPNFFDGWGDANYAGLDQVNIQNQADVADWPCFSKFYLSFPLDSVPAGKIITSARLRLHLFGNSEPSRAYASNIQVLTVAEDWNESAITWNNAPLGIENIAATRVEPILEFPGWPGVPYEWDVSGAVAEAYALSDPARLVLYSSDSPMHSGKYFSSSDTGDWNQDARPTLVILFGDSP